jgi:prepilin-type processing-associated H-X9-DG protein
MKTPARQSTAFTLIELLVVLATLALLAVMILPALARSAAQPKSAACAANFRQWAVSANLYANDYQDRLPSFDPYGGGSYGYDVGVGMCTNLGLYGLMVPTWFCPFRPAEWDAASSYVLLKWGHPVQTINELSSYFSHNYPGELNLNDNYWVPRNPNGVNPPVYMPRDWSILNPALIPSYVKGASSTVYGWPKKLHDNAVAHVPFVSDKCASGQSGGLNSPLPASTNLDNIAPNTAHFVNGILIGVNAAYADGHVESHVKSQLQPAYYNSLGANFWFY